MPYTRIITIDCEAKFDIIVIIGLYRLSPGWWRTGGEVRRE